MAYLTKEDLATHIYGENIDTITRGDGSIVAKAISAGLAEAQSYLGRYIIGYLFWDGVTVPDPAPSWWGLGITPITDENLKNKVKDLAAWHLVKLANPNINLELFRTAYEDAIDWLKLVQSGKSTPFGWPYRVDDPETPYVEGGTIQWTSNPKRNNHF